MHRWVGDLVLWFSNEHGNVNYGTICTFLHSVHFTLFDIFLQLSGMGGGGIITTAT